MLHSATVKRAEKLGVTLTEEAETGKVDAHWVQHNVHAYGIGAKAAMNEMEAIIKIKSMPDDYRVVNKPDDPFMILLFNHDRSLVLDRDGATPTDTLMLLEQAIENGTPWKVTKVPEDGGEAHKAGFHITDNPWPEPDVDDEEETTSWHEWNDDWEASADEAVNEEEDDEEEDDDKSSGSVVKTTYRIRYAEAGHPNHCGDWLAETLNGLILGKTATDLAKFEELCELNGVELAKYNRTTPGWQGRLRMTGRNLLARKIYLAGGVLALPESLRIEGGPDNLRAPDDWLATQRFKMPKSEQAVVPKAA